MGTTNSPGLTLHQQTSQLYSAEQSSPDLPVLSGHGVSAYLRGSGVCPNEIKQELVWRADFNQVFFVAPAPSGQSSAVSGCPQKLASISRDISFQSLHLSGEGF